jgi:APA family basic amino acid/polyamine antiporter
MPPSNIKAQVADSSHVAEVVMPAEFGIGTAVLVVIASMVGVGVLTTSGYIMASVKSNQYTLVLWMIGGVIALCGALTLSELSAALPHAGGDYVYLYHAYGPLAGFLSGWVSFLIGFSGPTAASAFAFAKYALAAVGGDPEPSLAVQRLLATAAVLAFASIQVSGRRRTAWLQHWITGLQLGFLVALVVAGLAVGSSQCASLRDARPIDRESLGGMLYALVYVYYAYTGWNGASFLAGEIRDPQRMLPRAIILGTLAVMGLYLAVNTVYALALSQSELRAMIDDPANTQGLEVVAPIARIAAFRLFGARWTPWVNVIVGLMLLSTLSAYLLQGPRVLYAMARTGQFPVIAARVTRNARTPAVATAFQVCMTLLLLWMGSFESIIVYASVGLSLFSMLAISAVYVLRWKRPDLERPFRTPGYPLTPAVFLGLTGLLTGAAFYQRPAASSRALLSILAGIPVYYLWNWSRRERPGQAILRDHGALPPG